MKLPRTKLGMARKQKTTSLGELLQTLDLNLNLGQATLRFWNLEDVCLEIGLAAVRTLPQSIFALVIDHVYF